MLFMSLIRPIRYRKGHMDNNLIQINHEIRNSKQIHFLVFSVVNFCFFDVF